jgi:hypothetical protein
MENGAGVPPVVDINNDGLQDLYVSASILADPYKRENLLYINQGSWQRWHTTF